METLGYGWRTDLTPNSIKEVEYAESPNRTEVIGAPFLFAKVIAQEGGLCQIQQVLHEYNPAWFWRLF